MSLIKMATVAVATLALPAIAEETPFETVSERGAVTRYLDKRVLPDGTLGAATHTLRADGSSFLLEYVFDCPARAYRYGALRHDTLPGEAELERMREITVLSMTSNLRKPTTLPVDDEPTPEIRQMFDHVCGSAQ